MPIYEYRCHDCRRRVSVFFRSFSDVDDEPVCPRCGGQHLSRLISRVSVVRSEDSRLDDLTDPGMLDGLDEDDPKSVARWMRRMGNEMIRPLIPVSPPITTYSQLPKTTAFLDFRRNKLYDFVRCSKISSRSAIKPK